MTDKIEITQADRDLVVSLISPWAGHLAEHRSLDLIANGSGDDAEAVQEVARHRAEAHAQGIEEAAAVAEDFDGQNSDPWGWPQLIAKAIRTLAQKEMDR